MSHQGRGQAPSISTVNGVKMPSTLSTLITAQIHRLSRSPTSSRNHQKLYCSPGGHTHDHHAVPPDRLHVSISISDAVLVAAEQYLSSVPVNQQSSRESDGGARNSLKSVLFHLNRGILSPTGGDDIAALQPVNPLTVATNVHTPYSWKIGVQGTADYGLPDDSFDISEVVTIPGTINGDADSSACGNRYTFTA